MYTYKTVNGYLVGKSDEFETDGASLVAGPTIDDQLGGKKLVVGIQVGAKEIEEQDESKDKKAKAKSDDKTPASKGKAPSGAEEEEEVEEIEAGSAGLAVQFSLDGENFSPPQELQKIEVKTGVHIFQADFTKVKAPFYKLSLVGNAKLKKAKFNFLYSIPGNSLE